MNTYGVLLFYNTSGVMRAEKILKQNGIAVKLIPTPREFSSDCGLAVRIAWEDQAHARAVLDVAKVEVAEIRTWG